MERCITATEIEAHYPPGYFDKKRGGPYVPKCPRHTEYQGFRKPRSGCEICQEVWAYKKKFAIKEVRAKWAGRKVEEKV